MYFLYILYSSAFDKTYVGFTCDLEARLDAHNHPQNKGYTRRFQPWERIHSERFATKLEAMKQENWYKSGVGRDQIQKILRDKGLR